MSEVNCFPIELDVPPPSYGAPVATFTPNLPPELLTPVVAVARAQDPDLPVLSCPACELAQVPIPVVAAEPGGLGCCLLLAIAILIHAVIKKRWKEEKARKGGGE